MNTQINIHLFSEAKIHKRGHVKQHCCDEGHESMVRTLIQTFDEHRAGSLCDVDTSGVQCSEVRACLLDPYTVPNQ
jgi:hypothetical protein